MSESKTVSGEEKVIPPTPPPHILDSSLVVHEPSYLLTPVPVERFRA